MANLTYTYTSLQTAVTHALAGAPDVNTSVGEIVNGALSWLVGMRPWRWRAKATTVTLVQSQSYVALPADFDELVSVRKTGDATGNIAPTSIDTIIDARQMGTNVNSGLWYCLDWLPQTGVTLEPTPILQIYPTPTVAVPGTLTLEYLRQVPKLSSGTDLPDIPSVYHELLRVACRAYALRIDGQAAGSDWELFQTMLPDYIARDGRSAGSNLGQFVGGTPRPPMRSTLARRTLSIGA